MRRLGVVAIVGALALALAGCGSGGSKSGAAGGSTSAATRPADDPDVGEVLRTFVEAAGNGDADTMWGLLSARSQKELGPGKEAFSKRLVKGFQRGLGSFAGTSYTTVLSVRTRSGWGVAAIAGQRVRGGKREFGAYAVALRREGGAWKLELGDPLSIANLAPGSARTRERRPAIEIRLTGKSGIDEAGLWVDGTPLPARATGSDPRDVRIQGRSERALSRGWHVVIGFGRSGDLAIAGAAPFRVEAKETGPVA